MHRERAEQIIVNMATMLNSMTAAAGNIVERNIDTIKFSGKSIPKVSVQNYLIRLHGYSSNILTNDENIFDVNASAVSIMLMALIYLDRLAMNSVQITYWSVHRLIAVGTWMALKMLVDYPPNAVEMAAVVGLDVTQLKDLEMRFVKLLGFNLHVSKSKFDEYINAYKGKGILNDNDANELYGEDEQISEAAQLTNLTSKINLSNVLDMPADYAAAASTAKPAQITPPTHIIPAKQPWWPIFSMFPKQNSNMSANAQAPSPMLRFSTTDARIARPLTVAAPEMPYLTGSINNNKPRHGTRLSRPVSAPVVVPRGPN